MKNFGNLQSGLSEFIPSGISFVNWIFVFAALNASFVFFCSHDSTSSHFIISLPQYQPKTSQTHFAWVVCLPCDETLEIFNCQIAAFT